MLREIETREALKMILAGEFRYLWWEVGKGTIGNRYNYFMPRVDEIEKTKWFVEEEVSE